MGQHHKDMKNSESETEVQQIERAPIYKKYEYIITEDEKLS
jgi:hypothetical protein